ncbi:hypothetical protein RUM43_005959 [Polyplax serrata]|uniref:Uncharacterized protein n=1 Tax=Polyplax serrata TaxID=468196 RepID=A0AAN8S381_POLSC
MNRLLLTLNIVAVVFLAQWNFCDSFKANVCDLLKVLFGLREELYSCVIECGDDKCRLTCYSFIPSKSRRNLWLHENFDRCTDLKVTDFVHEPEKFKQTIDQLLEKAKKKLPKGVWRETPLILVGKPSFHICATNSKSECLKPLMSTYLKETGFLVPKEPMVLLTDRNQGLLDWFTVNMMLGRLRGKQLKTVTVLNLELKSNQVTFVTSEEEQKTEMYKPYIASEEFGTGKQFQIYSRGFPHLGLGEIREKILKKGTYDGGVYYTECMFPSCEGSWQYNGVTYRVAGRTYSTNTTAKSKVSNSDGKVDVAKCESVVRQVLQPLSKVPSLTGRIIYGLNDYYQNFFYAGELDPLEGGCIPMEHMYKVVKHVCKYSHSAQDFLCMDTIYITVLLRDFYGLQPRDKIYLKGTIMDSDIQTTLGIAYLNLMAQFKETIDKLLEQMKKKIHKTLWEETPLMLVGTPRFHDYMTKNKLDGLKPLMSTYLKETGFLVPEEPMVLLNDRNEGLFDWFTVNMMLGRLRGKQLKTVTVLNLEFLSSQVTFVASEEEQNTEIYQPYITSEEFGTGKQFHMYSRGFPELGIGEIRQKIIKKGTYDGGVYYTDCMLPSFEGSLQYNGVTYQIAGRKNRTNPTLKSKVAKETAARVDVEKCESVVRQVIQQLPDVPSLTGREIYGLNDYYRNFVIAGQINRMEDGYMYMEDIYDVVKVTCRQSNFKVDYLCMDLMYIVVLLQDNYGLQPRDKIYLRDTIKNCDVQKTLGIAYLNLMAQVKKAK